ncbi:MAG: Spx/MgsR family RNA polymerase-binding regulatory protein [Gammaproteobacteria bacterium]|nr:Spx/MgsR family RNA polymerase-binding regulatory protein [Gammaproteobacteria bacterium]
MIKVYGLKNCGSCRQARRYLDQHQVEYQFVDLRAQPPQPGQVRAWLAILGEQRLLNRRSTTWRGLDESLKLPPGELTVQHLMALISKHPELVKRPLFVDGARMLTGFEAQALGQWLGAGEHADD